VPCSGSLPWEENLEETVQTIANIAHFESIPIDGVVFKFNDIAYGKSLGETAHHFKNAIAYKFDDEAYETKLRNLDWTMGRTGILTPVAVFDPVEIDGSVVERASLHNLDVLQNILFKPFIGQTISIYKANMIIP
jgi:DNA ligase (NAD+)